MHPYANITQDFKLEARQLKQVFHRSSPIISFSTEPFSSQFCLWARKETRREFWTIQASKTTILLSNLNGGHQFLLILATLIKKWFTFLLEKWLSNGVIHVVWLLNTVQMYPAGCFQWYLYQGIGSHWPVDGEKGLKRQPRRCDAGEGWYQKILPKPKGRSHCSHVLSESFNDQFDDKNFPARISGQSLALSYVLNISNYHPQDWFKIMVFIP